MELLKKLNDSNLFEVVEDYTNTKSEFNHDNSKLIEEILFIKLINKSPYNLLNMLCQMYEKRSLTKAEIVKILDKGGGNNVTLNKWLNCFIELGFLNKSPYSNKFGPRPRYQYSLTREFEEIMHILPSSYCKLIEKDHSYDKIVFSDVKKYIDGLNNNFSYVHVEKEEKTFNATRIIQSLLDNGAKIDEALKVLDDVSKRLEAMLQESSKYGFIIIIDKKQISSQISKVLLKMEMYNVLYHFEADIILRQNNMEYAKDSYNLFKKKIMNNKYNRKYTYDELFNIIFKQVYDINIDDLHKDKLIFQTKEIIQKFSNKNVNNYLLIEYCKLLNKIALSILLNIRYLSKSNNPITSLRNILKKKNNATIINLRSLESFDDFYSAIISSARWVTKLNNENNQNVDIDTTQNIIKLKDSNTVKISEMELNLKKIIQFYELSMAM